mmetsp:Transcript_60764/g.142153  ORF Transcript_60764/g.142153 Transcript_60764/m.142153 type:complete len:234 (-) Transcript_60764:442-1143(-)
MLVVNPMPPTVLPEADVLFNVLGIFCGLVQQGSRGKRLTLHPKVLLRVAPFPVWAKAVDQTTMLVVPGQVPRSVEELLRSVDHPEFGPVAMDVQEVLRPLNLMTRLEAPRSVDVGGVVLVILPIDLKVHVVVLPDKAPAFGCQLRSKSLGKHFGTVQITHLQRCFVGSNECLAHVHVGVLPSVAVVHDTFSADGVQIGALVRQPELPLQHVKDASDSGVVLCHPGGARCSVSS